MDLPFREVWHPLGFDLHLATNSRQVQEAAAESWQSFRREFARETVELRIVVQEEGEAAPEPAFRSQGNMLSIVSDRHNFGCLDLDALFGYCFVSAKTVAERGWFRWFFLEPATYLMLAQRHVSAMHAACVERDGVGVLLCGVSTAGKSTLAYACARQGWTYISDDATCLLLDSDERVAIGKPHQIRFRDDAPRLFPELEGYITRARPNGKISIEVPTAELPIRTAGHANIGAVVVLDRRSGAQTRLERAPREEVAEGLLADMPYYGETVLARYEQAVQRATAVPTYRLIYEKLDEAVTALNGLLAK